MESPQAFATRRSDPTSRSEIRAALLGVCVCAGLGSCFGYGTTPSAATLRRQFTEHRPAFERLRALFQEDTQLSGVSVDRVDVPGNAAWPRPASELGISEARWEEYRKDLTALHLEGVRRYTGYHVPEGIYFVAHVTGIAGRGSLVGVMSTSDPVPGNRGVFTAGYAYGEEGLGLQKITDSWYVFRKRD